MNALLERVPGIGAPIARDEIPGGTSGRRLFKMKEAMQNPAWHGEGDMLTHTRMVCEERVRISVWRALPQKRRQSLFVAALFHDMGKTACARMEDGIWVSPHHAAVDARMRAAFSGGNSGCAGRRSFRRSGKPCVRSSAGTPSRFAPRTRMRPRAGPCAPASRLRINQRFDQRGRKV